jgi:hypothetical protein
VLAPAHPGGSIVSALDDLSPIARQALVDSCAESGVPIQLTDAVTVARLAALLRPESRRTSSETASPGRHSGQDRATRSARGGAR